MDGDAMTEVIVLDPSAVAPDRAQLDITSWVDADPGVDWGDAQITAYMADQAVGSSPVDYRLPNRQIKIPLNLRAVGSTSFSTVRTSLQSKAALFQRAGGQIMRQVDSTPLYADVVNATLHLGGSIFQAYRGFDVDAVLTLECLPDFYGDEITLDSASAAGVYSGVLKSTAVNASILGNYPARCRIVVTDTSGNDQLGLFWGVRSRFYDSASTAGLFYEAEAMTLLNAGTTVASAGASGGTFVRLSSPPTAAWIPMLSTDLTSGGALTHQGTYRAWARVTSPNGDTRVRLLWGVGTLAVPVTNDAAVVPGDSQWYLKDLGTVRLDAPPVGGNQWHGVVQTYTTASGTLPGVDCIYFQPLDESAGKLAYTNVPPPSSVSQSAISGTNANDASTGTTAWSIGALGGYDGIVLGASAISQYLKCTNFGFAIPAGATVLGVQVAFSRFDTTGAPHGPLVKDNQVQLVKAGTVQAGANHAGAAIWPPTITGTVYGGPTDLWGVALTPTDVNNSGFGFALSATNSSGSFTAGGNVYTSSITITVYYTLAAGFTVASDAVVYASKTTELRYDGMYRQASGGTIYGPVSQVTGDLPRLPPSGLESQPVQALVKPSHGDLDTLPDINRADGFNAQVKYRPSYLYTP
jgi:hypothetical protein